jgi:hypothetical protein
MEFIEFVELKAFNSTNSALTPLLGKGGAAL